MPSSWSHDAHHHLIIGLFVAGVDFVGGSILLIFFAVVIVINDSGLLAHYALRVVAAGMVLSPAVLNLHWQDKSRVD